MERSFRDDSVKTRWEVINFVDSIFISGGFIGAAVANDTNFDTGERPRQGS
jgi:hypothetical protein